MNVGELDTTVINYINELKAYYEQQINILKNEVIHFQNQYLGVKEKLDLLLYKQFARKAEKIPVDDKQKPLFTNEVEPQDIVEENTTGDETFANEDDSTEVKSYTRKKPGRKPINPNIPRVEKIIDIPESEKTCACGAKLTRIGEETSENLQRIPEQIYVEKIIRPKYACRCCEGTADEEKPAVKIAPVAPAIIPRSIASPSLLAAIFTHKFVDHLPYNRQEMQFERIGVEISRQDMTNWQQHIYQKHTPLFDLLKETVKSGEILKMDETTVQVMGEEGREDTQKSYMWLARGGPPGKTVVWYEYQKSRAASHAKSFLEGYKGFLQTDGYDGYDSAIKDMSGIIHVGCFSHARRYFFEASKVSKTPQSAEEGIKYIRKLYNLENELRDQDLDDKKFLAERKARAGPILEQFKSWLLKRKDEVPPSMLLGKAINYSLTQWDKMVKYLESPHLTPDNNACENAIRPFVLGRKNWLFCQSPEGAKSSCGIYTLIETAKQNGIEPYKYLKALFEKSPLAKTIEDWKNLLPWNIFKN